MCKKEDQCKVRHRCSKWCCWLFMAMTCCAAVCLFYVVCHRCGNSSPAHPVKEMRLPVITNIICDSTCCPCKGDFDVNDMSNVK